MKRWVVWSALLLAGTAMAQQAGLGHLVYPEKLRADADAIQRALIDAHPDPFRFVAPEEAERAFQDLKDSLRVPLSTDRFAFLLTQALARIGDGGIEVVLDAATEARLRDAPQLPFIFKLLPDGLYIEQELKGFRSFPPGSRILSINGLGHERIVRDCGRWVLTDGANETRRWHALERALPVLFVLTYGAAPRYLIEAELPDGTRREEVVHGMREAEIQASLRPAGAPLMPWRTTWDEDSGTLWVTLTTMDAAVLKRAGQRPQRFVQRMLQQLRRDRARNLVLDLRGCEGHDRALAEAVFAAVAKEPFRLLQAMMARRSAWPEGKGLVEVPGPRMASIDASPAALQPALLALPPDDPRLRLVKPLSGAFEGRVFVVADGGTRHAAAALAMLANRTRRARLVGAETGSNAHAFTSGGALLVTAPNSGIGVKVPTVRCVPEGQAAGPDDRGELPRHAASQLPWALARGRDGLRLSLLEMIRALQ